MEYGFDRGASTGSSVTGNVTVQRYMSGEGRLYRYLSSPVNNATVALMDDFPVTGTFLDPTVGSGIVSASPSLFAYDESVGMFQEGWQAYSRSGPASDAPLAVGQGYAAFVRNRTSTLLDLAGTINQGDIQLPLGYTEHNGTGNGWHLVGNPYPAAIDWDATVLDKVALSQTIASATTVNAVFVIGMVITNTMKFPRAKLLWANRSGCALSRRVLR